MSYLYIFSQLDYTDLFLPSASTLIARREELGWVFHFKVGKTTTCTPTRLRVLASLEVIWHYHEGFHTINAQTL